MVVNNRSSDAIIPMHRSSLMASVSIYTEKEGSQRINKVTTNLQGHHSEAGVYINIYLTNMLSQQTLYSDIGAYVNIQFNKM